MSVDKFPLYPKMRAECIAESSESEDGTYIAGHGFGQVIAFEDEHTGRWYMVDLCMECGTPTVSFVEAHSGFVDQAKQYPVVEAIGGNRE